MKHWTNFIKTNLESKKKWTKDGYITQYEPIFFDSETSKKTHMETVKNGKEEQQVEVVDDCWVYIWACSVGKDLYYGRCIHEFFDFMRLLVNVYGIDQEHCIDIQVHNLSYDISYMWDLIFKFDDNKGHALFSDTRKIITYNMNNGFTFKCTYRMSGRSLDKWCKDLGVEHRKLVGAINYQETHYPYDKLEHDQYKYLAYDVMTLKDCYYKEISLQGYKFTNCPLTMTGFVRKMFQKAYRTKGMYYVNHKIFQSTKLNNIQYSRLLKAAAGGMTASSIRYISRKVFHPFGIGHIDFESHYPTQQRIHKFPMRPTTIKEDGDGKRLTFQQLKWYQKKFDCYYVVEIELKNIELKKGVTAPFLFRSKCCIDSNAKVIQCNGKLVKVQGVLKCCVTNFDLEIIRDQYKIRYYNIKACDTYETQYLPGYILDVVDKLYADKTNYKRMVKEDPHNDDLKATYNMKKAQLNSVFGCSYTKPVRPDIQINENFTYEIDYAANTLEDYYNNKNSCMMYQAGVFTTSLARFELFKIIRDVVGYENFLYCDTDSAFYLDSPSIRYRIDQYNEECEKDSHENHYQVVLDTGEIKYYHHLDYEDDSGKAKIFKSLHAKCYALQYGDGSLSITVAGVPKKTADGFTREEELQSIDNMVSGFTFEKCGGSRADYSTIREYSGYSGGGCAVLDTTKTIHEILFTDEEWTYHEV